jgi:hypothetical protein
MTFFSLRSISLLYRRNDLKSSETIEKIKKYEKKSKKVVDR